MDVLGNATDSRGSNPTRVAVALKYDQKEMASPVVLAKGYDDVAQRIKAIAAEHNIWMVENVTPARALAREVQVRQRADCGRH